MYKFNSNIKIRKVSNSKILLIDPTVGAWCFSTESELTIIKNLKTILESSHTINLTPIFTKFSFILEKLYLKGLVSKNGAFVYSNINFNHSQNKTNTIILKLVGHCNLACSYCYDYNSVRYKLRMPIEKAKQAIDGVWKTSGENLNIIFHGGEPMLEKKLIFDIVEYVRTKNILNQKNVGFSIQTNGTMFDQEWVDHLMFNNYSIGVSLDGDQYINDKNRYYHNKKGSFKGIMTLIDSFPDLKKRISILTTVTSSNVDSLYEIALFFQNAGFKSWKSILYQKAGRSEQYHDDLEPSNEKVVEAYLKLLDGIANGAFPNIKLTSLLSYIDNVLFYTRNNMCLRSSCGAGSDLISISVDGKIEACDCIVNTEFNLGVLNSKESIASALNSSIAKKIRARSVETLFQCKSCDWRKLCGGTCLAKTRQLESIDPTECLLSLNLFESIFNSLGESNSLIEYANKFKDEPYIQNNSPE